MDNYLDIILKEYKLLEKTSFGSQISELSKQAIRLYSTQKFTLVARKCQDKNLSFSKVKTHTHTGKGLSFKPGVKGTLLDIKALDLFPDFIKNKVLQVIKDHKVKLCAINGYLVTLPPDRIRVPKKEKDLLDSLL